MAATPAATTNVEDFGAGISQKIIRVDIDRQRQRALRLYVLQPFAQEGLDIHLARGLDQEAPAVAAAHECDGGGGRSQHGDAFASRCDACDNGVTKRSVSAASLPAMMTAASRAIGRQAGIFADESFPGRDSLRGRPSSGPASGDVRAHGFAPGRGPAFRRARRGPPLAPSAPRCVRRRGGRMISRARSASTTPTKVRNGK